MLSSTLPPFLSLHERTSPCTKIRQWATSHSLPPLYQSNILSLSLCLSIMEAIAREKGVLKLVHPGRYVEIHKGPITAAEVMERNPRHCITRPDVFKFPWVVVRPESVLVPGKVFFIVPNRTIYKLLKAHEEHNQQPSPNENQSNKNIVCHEKSSPIKAWAGMTPRNLINNSSCFFPWNENPRTHPKVKSWPEMNSRQIIKPRQRNEQETSVNLTADEIKPSSTKEHSVDRDSNTDYAKLPQNQPLKSCIRKPENNDRKLLGLRVTFVLPKKDDEKPRRITESQDSTGFMSW